MSNALPTVDDLIGLGQFWDGDKAQLPNGYVYWRFMIFKYHDGRTYVLENHWSEKNGKLDLEQIVKRLY